MPAHPVEALFPAPGIEAPPEAAVAAPEPEPPRSGIVLDFTAADLVPEGPRPRGQRPGERMHSMYETCYGRLGPALLREGWASYPQTIYTRRPGTVDKVTLKWGHLKYTLPTVAEMRSWSLQCPDENVAVVLGEYVPGVNLFAVDVDVSDVYLSNAIREAAAKHMGETPFLRFGRVPRCIMVYRLPTGVLLRKRSYRFAEVREDGTWGASEHSLELLGAGSSFTAYGTHHKTGGYFTWPDAQPMLDRPETAPLVTLDQLDKFLVAVQEIRRFATKRCAVAGESVETDYDAPAPFDMSPHGLLPDMTRGDWVVQDGRVVDGRHTYLRDLAWRLVRANASAFGQDDLPDEAARSRREADRVALRRWAVVHVRDHVAEDGRRDRQAMTRALNRELDSLTERLALPHGDERRVVPLRTRQGADGRHHAPGTLTTSFARDPALSWLGERSAMAGLTRAAGGRLKVSGVTAATPEETAARQLGGDRVRVCEAVAACVEASAAAWIADLGVEGAEAVGRVHVNLGPTGAGKSTRTIKALAQMLKAERAAGVPRRGPVVFLLPSHANIAEALQVAQAEGMTLAGVEALVAQAESLGLRAVHFKGKALAGCERLPALKMLHEAKLDTSGLCKSDLLDDEGNPVYNEKNQPVQDRCIFFKSCGYQRMLKALETADVVFASHYWLTSDRLPKVLSEARGLVIDESVVHQVLQMTTVPMPVLLDPKARPLPELTRDEVKELRERFRGNPKGFSTARTLRLRGLVSDRVRAAQLLQRCHVERLDPVRVFATTEGALEWTRSAKRVCADSYSVGRDIYVSHSDAQVEAVCKEARPAHLDGERRLWGVLIEAVERHLAEERARVEAGLPEPDRGPDPLPLDTRLQPVSDGEDLGLVRSWRVSWRLGTNWLAAPTLLLDATADLKVLKLLHAGREVVPYSCDAALNLRTILIADRSYAPSSLFPAPDAEQWRREAAGPLRGRVAALAHMVAAAHGHGRTLVTTPHRIRDLWEAYHGRLPVVDYAHYGALRGQDFARDHLAAVGVGRSEQPIRVVDGLVAALTWDEHPEHPHDRLGTGRDAAGKPLRRVLVDRTIRVRSGHDALLAVPCMPTDWGRRVESLWREAELVQFIGRLRGVYRPEPGTVVLLADCPPDGLLVDDLLTLDEALSRSASGHEAWRGLEEARGVLLPGVTDRATRCMPDHVQALVRHHADWPSMRTLTCTDEHGVEHKGLVAAWVGDVRAALRDLGAPPAMVGSAVVTELRATPVPSRPRPMDERMRAAENMRLDYETWQVSHRLGIQETRDGYLARFLSTYDPDDYVVDPEDEAERDEPVGVVETPWVDAPPALAPDPDQLLMELAC